MPKFTFTPTALEGVTIIEPTVYGDDRGYFMETYHEQDFHAA
ncbi:MAG: dTDP-4-dehydrorhamnose 3,5-epimerase family protein, partial [Coriobacteriales bacterium]|nr:dTDP-4-dehydrorhamnose 3,5-epimerase family protein [Coriobacteriales bacterium]